MNKAPFDKIMDFKNAVESQDSTVLRLAIAVCGQKLVTCLSKEPEQINELIPAIIHQMKSDPNLAKVINMSSVGFHATTKSESDGSTKAGDFEKLFKNLPKGAYGLVLTDLGEGTVLVAKGDFVGIISSICSAMEKSPEFQYMIRQAIEIFDNTVDPQPNVYPLSKASKDVN